MVAQFWCLGRILIYKPLGEINACIYLRRLHGHFITLGRNSSSYQQAQSDYSFTIRNCLYFYSNSCVSCFQHMSQQSNTQISERGKEFEIDEFNKKIPDITKSKQSGLHHLLFHQEPERSTTVKLLGSWEINIINFGMQHFTTLACSLPFPSSRCNAWEGHPGISQFIPGGNTMKAPDLTFLFVSHLQEWDKIKISSASCGWSGMEKRPCSVFDHIIPTECNQIDGCQEVCRQEMHWMQNSSD